jgi:hypothetical protein
MTQRALVEFWRIIFANYTFDEMSELQALCR